MTPTADDFRALARSSPWLWQTLHFTHVSAGIGEVEAWVRRPGELLVETPSGARHRVSGLPHTRVFLSAQTGDGPPSPVPPVPPSPVPPQQVSPEWRADGLVASRPDGWEVEYDDPMWQDYSWVAMLDPVELSDHVDVRDVRVGELAGRPTWEARLVALDGYEPRCGCCSLLTSEAVDREEWGRPRRGYPDHHDVALDRGTGVVVRCIPVGGEPDLPWLENRIHEVDADLDDLFG